MNWRLGWLGFVFLAAAACAPAPSASSLHTPVGPPPTPRAFTPTPFPATPTPTPIPTATPRPRAGWLTFFRPDLATVEYPPDWTVRAEAASATFTSAQGLAILLRRVETGGAPPERFLETNLAPQSRCARAISDYDVPLVLCESATETATAAAILQWPNSPPRLLALSPLGRGVDLALWRLMAASLR